MEVLNFSLLTLEFVKYKSELQNNGINFDYHRASNMFQDKVVLQKSNGNQILQFIIEHRKWDRYREFTLNISSGVVHAFQNTNATQYHFRLNPLSGQPMFVNKYESTSSLFNPWENRELPTELNQFGESILQIINSLIQKINIDKVELDSIEKS
tara:strand:+ start:2860 stop:3321 length:462 start_codon:yes stop_codon:yes gene_type:complete